MIIYILILLVVLLLIVVTWAYHDMTNIRVTKYIIKSDKIKEPFHFVFLSDIHGFSFGPGNKKLIELIDSIKPDAVISGGDLYTSHPGDNCKTAVALIEQLTEKYPVYMANGNHETKTRIYPEDFNNMYADYIERVKAAGAKLIINDSMELSENNIRLTGFEIKHKVFRRVFKVPINTEEIYDFVGKPNTDSFNILLAHNPIYLEEYAKWGADLVMSGHIHGGIIRVPWIYRRKHSYIDDENSGFGIRTRGIISPMFWIFPRFDGGLFRKGNTQMILSRGLSTHTIPVRLNNPGELVEVYLEK